MAGSCFPFAVKSKYNFDLKLEVHVLEFYLHLIFPTLLDKENACLVVL
jgi:hypothetical protein